MLRVTFHAGTGESPSRMLAQCLRFYADGTLRGPDNCVVARFADGFWQVGNATHREESHEKLSLHYTVCVYNILIKENCEW